MLASHLALPALAFAGVFLLAPSARAERYFCFWPRPDCYATVDFDVGVSFGRAFGEESTLLADESSFFIKPHFDNGFFGRINDRMHVGLGLEGGFTRIEEAPNLEGDFEHVDYYLVPKATFRVFLSELWAFDASSGVAFSLRTYEERLGAPSPRDLYGPQFEAGFVFAGVITGYSSVQTLHDYDDNLRRELHIQGGVRVFLPIPAIFARGMSL